MTDPISAIHEYCRGCPCWCDKVECFPICPLEPYKPQHVESK